MTGFYLLTTSIQYFTITVLFIQCMIVFRRGNTKINMIMLFNTIVTLITSIGFLFQSQAQSLETYLTAIQMSYLGKSFIAFSSFILVANLCHVKLSRIVVASLASIQVILYFFILSMKRHELFYKDSSFTFVDGFPKFTHSNGIVHNIFTIIMILYIIVGTSILIRSIHKEKSKVIRRRLNLVFLSVAIEAVFYAVQVSGIFDITKRLDFNIIGFPIGTIIMFIAIVKYDLLGTKEMVKETIVDRFSEGIIVVNKQNEIKYLNECANELYPELKDSQSILPESILDSFSGGKELTINGRIFIPEEKTLIQNGEEYGKMYIIVDVTDTANYIKELDEQRKLAESANNAKSTFLANMSHDIRTPINAIMGMNKMILRECDDDNIISYAHNINRASNTLLDLINDILDLSKLEAGKLEIIPAEYDLTSMLNDLVNMIQPRADAKGLIFEPIINESIPRMLFGDVIRLKQIATNILTNAVKYTKKGKVVFSISYEKISDDSISLQISVEDTGVGIKKENITKLFTKFDRIEEERNRTIEGTGLGMSITVQLLSMMGSEINVESEYGKGSVFSFAVEQKVISWEGIGDLQNALKNSLIAREKYHESFTAPTAQLLVVDDTAMNLTVFSNLLKRTLMKIDTAESGDAGVELSAKKKYDIIFLDYMMPEKNGIQTLHEIRETDEGQNQDTPIICLTANAISGAKEKLINAGFNDYLTKPIEPDKLEEMIINYLPKDKVTTITKVEDKNNETKIPSTLYQINEIEVTEGLKFNGDADAYLQAIKTYASSVPGKCDEIEKLWRSDDIENMTIKVHAIKSTSRLIGASGIGNFAQLLEDAGHSGDNEYIAAHAGELLERCRRLASDLAPLFKSEELPLISDAELKEAYTLIQEFISVSDLKSVIQIIDNLKEYSYPESEKEKCEKLKAFAAEFDYEGISKVMSK